MYCVFPRIGRSRGQNRRCVPGLSQLVRVEFFCAIHSQTRASGPHSVTFFFFFFGFAPVIAILALTLVPLSVPTWIPHCQFFSLFSFTSRSYRQEPGGVQLASQPSSFLVTIMIIVLTSTVLGPTITIAPEFCLPACTD